MADLNGFIDFKNVECLNAEPGKGSDNVLKQVCGLISPLNEHEYIQ
jgi:hypothetical protein